jgi:hypothetical protein
MASPILPKRRVETSLAAAPEDFRSEPRNPLAVAIDDAQLAHMVAEPFELAPQPHTLGNVISQSPKIDDIAVGAKRRGALDEDRLEASRFEPEGERRPCNADSRNQYRLRAHDRGAGPAGRRCDRFL